MMFGIEFKFTFTKRRKNTPVIRIQHNEAVHVLLGGISKSYGQCGTWRQEAVGQRSSEMRSVLLHQWEEHREEYISAPGKLRKFKEILDLNRI